MKSWKTTAAGILAGVGASFAAFFPEYSRYGLFAASIGTVLMGVFARDNGVTSEQAGATDHTYKPTTP